mmetsp:Transcript_40049/g.159335  ORF Transcript_40049/g.159335 Transcript_40049/m.159335 type:complete len:218 (-) Transcript_40049:137-790(-)
MNRLRGVSISRSQLNGLIWWRNEHRTGARGLSSLVTNSELARRVDIMDQLGKNIMTPLWNVADEHAEDEVFKAENQIQWYRNFYAKNGKDEGELSKDLYFAAEELYNVLHAYHATRLLSEGMLSMENELLRQSGPLGTSMGRLSDDLTKQVHGWNDAVTKFIMTLPPKSTLRFKCNKELSWSFACITSLLELPRASYDLKGNTGSGFYLPDERLPDN